MGHCKINEFHCSNYISMKRLSSLIVLASMALTMSGVAHSADATAAPKADLAKGEATATAVCVACHATDGSRGLADNPILQGQHPQYILKQLQEFKSGTRKSAIMAPMASMLSDEDMLNVAAFYAAKKPLVGAAKNPATVELGERIYRGGIAKKSVPACAGCHSPNGAGIPAQYPRLGGQHAAYIKAQLVAFRQEERTNNASMAEIASNLSDKEIDAVADYIGGLR